VTEGYIRIHCLQANSNDGTSARDPNGGDLVVLEIWSVGAAEICDNGVDDDGDDLVDCDDPDCECGGGFVRGDADASGAVNITDAIFLLGYLFQGTGTPTCLDAADVDDQGPNAPNITDAIFLLGWLFQGTAFPPEPTPMNADGTEASASYAAGQSCGPDETPDDNITCLEFAPCAQ
jgi:hypothetical protein